LGCVFLGSKPAGTNPEPERRSPQW
jgi:hypothetical protein